MEKMKILFISRAYPPVVGGIENQNYELGKSLGESADVTLVANKKGKKALPFFFAYIKILILATGWKYDTILLGDGVLAPVGWIGKLVWKKPVICVVHGLDLTFKMGLYQKLWVGFFIKKMDRLIAVGNETVRVAIEKGIPGEKVVFIANGIDTGKHIVQTNRFELEKILGIDVSDKKVLLTSGRLAKRKGVAWFIENVLPKLSKDVLYVVAGNGPDKENIQKAIKKEKMEKRVFMLGYVTDPVRDTLMNSCDLFIQANIAVPGDMEGFGISVIEAASCKIPVLAANLEGLKDAIKDGKNGYLIEPENATAWERKIKELLADENACKEFGEKARAFVIENYDWKKISQAYLQEIEKVIKQ